jgi:uncharacterized protein (DUF1697 family)
MTTYISILRGINVSGQKQVRMTDLKALYEELGFSNVITYIQSGNVIFNSGLKVTITEISGLIEEGIMKEFGFHVPVIIRSVDELKSVILANPFVKKEGPVPAKLYITFLKNKPQTTDIDNINNTNFLPDKFIILEREVYLDCAGGYGTTKLSNTFFENKLKVKATTRNWNTVNKLMEIAGSVGQLDS